MMAQMDNGAINKCSLAYVSYLLIALTLFLGVVAESGDWNFIQAVGWVYFIAIWTGAMVLPAGLAGLLLSLVLRRHWSREWGVIALPLLLVVWIGVFAYEEQLTGQYYWLNVVGIVYVILAVAIAARWFLYGRKRAAEFVTSTQDSSKATGGREAVKSGPALASGLIAALLGMAPGRRFAGRRRPPWEADGDGDPDDTD